MIFSKLMKSLTLKQAFILLAGSLFVALAVTLVLPSFTKRAKAPKIFKNHLKTAESAVRPVSFSEAVEQANLAVYETLEKPQPAVLNPVYKVQNVQQIGELSVESGGFTQAPASINSVISASIVKIPKVEIPTHKSTVPVIQKSTSAQIRAIKPVKRYI